MPYFFVIPAFLLFVVVMTVALIVTSSVESLRRWRPYVASILLWSSLGFLVCNVLVSLLYLVPLLFPRLPTKPDFPGSTVLAVVFVGGLLIGPFIASFVGVVGGALIAVRRVHRKHRATSAPA